jgi:hypothetical protein
MMVLPRSYRIKNYLSHTNIISLATPRRTLCQFITAQKIKYMTSFFDENSRLFYDATGHLRIT